MKTALEYFIVAALLALFAWAGWRHNQAAASHEAARRSIEDVR